MACCICIKHKFEPFVCLCAGFPLVCVWQGWGSTPSLFLKSSHLNKCLPIWHPLPPKNEALLPLKNKAPLLRIDYWGKIPNIKNYYCFNFFICYLTAPWPTWDNYHSNSLTCPLLITVLLSIFDPKRAPMLSSPLPTTFYRAPSTGGCSPHVLHIYGKPWCEFMSFQLKGFLLSRMMPGTCITVQVCIMLFT